jgi:transposase InsO family protein
MLIEGCSPACAQAGERSAGLLADWGCDPTNLTQENTVTALTHSIKRKLSLLQLAEELGNVARACKIMGFHRDTFYEVRRAFQTGGVAALVENRRGARNPHPNRLAPEIETRVLDYCLVRPTHGAQRVSNELRLQGVEVSPSGVRAVWLRHDLETRYKRLMRLERESRDSTTFILTDEQIRLLERHSPDFRCRHVESSAAGELLNQDTFYWGSLKGVGKVYVQVVVDTFCSLAFAKCYSSKMPITACDLLYERVLPFYDALGVPVKAILTDNGREFCGRPDTHPYELLLAIEDIEHRNTKVRSPRTNGFVERMNRTLLDECFRVKGRETFYLSIAEIQRDLDAFMRHYNTERSHQGYRLNGQTPAAALRAALGIEQLPSLDFAAVVPEIDITEQEAATDTVNT